MQQCNMGIHIRSSNPAHYTHVISFKTNTSKLATSVKNNFSYLLSDFISIDNSMGKRVIDWIWTCNCKKQGQETHTAVQDLSLFLLIQLSWLYIRTYQEKVTMATKSLTECSAENTKMSNKVGTRLDLSFVFIARYMFWKHYYNIPKGKAVTEWMRSYSWKQQEQINQFGLKELSFLFIA